MSEYNKARESFNGSLYLKEGLHFEMYCNYATGNQVNLYLPSGELAKSTEYANFSLTENLLYYTIFESNQTRDEGTYTCEMISENNNKTDALAKNVVFFNESTLEILPTNHVIHVELHETAEIVVPYKAFPPPLFAWYNRSIDIPGQKGMNILSSDSEFYQFEFLNYVGLVTDDEVKLTIRNATESLDFVLVAFNPLNYKTDSFKVIVTGEF